MAEDNEFELNEEQLQEMQEQLGASADFANLSVERQIRTLGKLELRDRARLRLQYELDALVDDNTEIPVIGIARAHADVTAAQRSDSGRTHEVAGLPVGSPTPMVEAPTAGLAVGGAGWTELGPGNIGGRTRAIVIDPADTDRLYAASVAGGVWRSTNAGQDWTVLDDFMSNLAVCCLVMDPADTNTIYAGTGEGFGNVDAVRGDGIFRTTDGGITWTQLAATAGNINFQHVNALAITSDGQTLLAGTNGGIFRSTDAGANWVQSATDTVGNLVLDPLDNNNAAAISGYNRRAHPRAGAITNPAQR